MLPKDDTPGDPSYADGEAINVATYLTSRATGRIEGLGPLNGNEAFYSETSGFDNFQIVMEHATQLVWDSAMSGTAATTLVGLTTAVLAMNF